MKKVEMVDLSREIKEFTTRSLKAQREAVARGLARSIHDLVAASPMDTGLYSASWDFTVDEYKGVIGNHAPYAGIIEYGSKPFTPPIGPLLQWAHRVLNGTGAERGQPLSAAQVEATGKSPLSGYSSDEWALAKGAQKAIAKRGMIPRHIMQNMIPTIIENIRKELKS